MWTVSSSPVLWLPSWWCSRKLLSHVWRNATRFQFQSTCCLSFSQSWCHGYLSLTKIFLFKWWRMCQPGKSLVALTFRSFARLSSQIGHLWPLERQCHFETIKTKISITVFSTEENDCVIETAAARLKPLLSEWVTILRQILSQYRVCVCVSCRRQ